MSGLSTTPPWSGAGPAITARCGSHSTMRAPMPISLSTKKSRDSNSFSKISRIPSHCDATTIAMDMRSAGNAGHGPSSSFGTCPPRSGRIRRSWPASTISWAPSRRGRTPSRSNPNRILRRSSLRTPSIDRAVGDGGEPDERADLDVVRSHRAGGGLEGRSAFDGERVRPDALDLRAQSRQKARQILNVRLAGGVAQRGRTAGGDRRHQGVFGRRDTRFVEKNIGPGEALRFELVGGADGDFRPEPLEGEEMRIHAPPADHIATRGR